MQPDLRRWRRSDHQRLAERKARFAQLLKRLGPPLLLSDHQTGRGAEFCAETCKLGVEGIVSKRADAPYVPGDRGLWLKTKCLDREEFVVIGWTDPEESRPYVGAVLLGYYDDDGGLIYAGRGGTGIGDGELKRLWHTLQPLATDKMPLEVPPPRSSRFGSPLELSRVHWVRPELVVEVAFLAWTEEGLLRLVTYQGIREDKPAKQVRRPPSPGALHRAEQTSENSRRPARAKISKENIQRFLTDAAVQARTN